MMSKDWNGAKISHPQLLGANSEIIMFKCLASMFEIKVTEQHLICKKGNSKTKFFWQVWYVQAHLSTSKEKLADPQNIWSSILPTDMHFNPINKWAWNFGLQPSCGSNLSLLCTMHNSEENRYKHKQLPGKQEDKHKVTFQTSCQIFLRKS